jgi:hypothetical protein
LFEDRRQWKTDDDKGDDDKGDDDDGGDDDYDEQLLESEN